MRGSARQEAHTLALWNPKPQPLCMAIRKERDGASDTVRVHTHVHTLLRERIDWQGHDHICTLHVLK
jgi:hypothetical protein